MELNTIERWIQQTLTNDSQLMALVTGIYAHPAPKKAVEPFVAYQLQPGTSSDTNGLGGRRILVNTVYLVRVIGKDCGIEDLKTAADRMDSLLTAQPFQVILGCVREQPFSMIEPDEGVRYAHLGGLYLIQAQ